MFVDVDVSRCVGCGLCEENHPEIFVMGRRHASVVQPVVPVKKRPLVRLTVADCPAGAIVVRDRPSPC